MLDQSAGVTHDIGAGKRTAPNPHGWRNSFHAIRGTVGRHAPTAAGPEGCGMTSMILFKEATYSESMRARIGSRMRRTSAA